MILLAGCAHTPCQPVEKPVFVGPPAQCLAPCEYVGPAAITTNGELLEAYRGRLEQAQCYASRLACVQASGQQ